VYRGSDPISNLRIASDQRGGQVASFRDRALMRANGGRFRAQRIPHVGDIALPGLAVASNGAAALAWSVFSDDTIRVTVRQPGRRFAAPRVISRSPRRGAIETAHAVDTAGRATVVWPEASAIRPAGMTVVTTSRTGRRASVEHVAYPRIFGTGFFVARDARGRGTIVWTDADSHRLVAAYGS
jgi:hypothetical protein